MSASGRRAWLYAAVLAGLIVLADQVSKAVIEDRLVYGERVAVAGPLELTHVGNTGIAFGLAGGGGAAIVALTLVALTAIAVVFARDPSRRGVWLAVGLLIGGAVGNLIDRIEHGVVTDFIRLPHFPAFNVADIAITFGVIALAWVFLREPEPSAGPGEPAEEAPVGDDRPDGEERGGSEVAADRG